MSKAMFNADEYKSANREQWQATTYDRLGG
jgi:hypothetical protein